MTIRNLDRMLAPRSLAFIGASPQAGSLGSIIARNLLRGGFAGPISLVNPRHREIGGLPCAPSVAALSEPPDLAVIATPPSTVPGLIAELGARGTKAAVVISAGIRGDLRQAMLDASRPHFLRILGPNCLGLMLPGLGLDASFSHIAPVAGDLALVSQSGALITGIVDWASSRGIGFSHVVSLGDMADIDFGDMLDYLAGDTRSRAILLYMESLTSAAKFLSAARRAARAKPVIVIKAGRHAEGAKAAQSHTGALAGSDEAYAAAFRRAGLLRVYELEDLFHAAEVLARVPRLEGEQLMILTNGGGAGVLAADRLADLGGRLAPLPEPVVRDLDGLLPAAWSRANPVDIIGDADASRYSTALGRLLGAGIADAILIMNCPTAVTSSTAVAQAIVAVKRQREAAGLPVKPLLASWLGDGAARDGRQLLAAAGIPTFGTPASAIEGLMQLVRHRRAQDELLQTPRSLPPGEQPDAGKAARIIGGALGRGAAMLSEVEAKELVAAYGIPTVATRVAGTAAEARALAHQILGSARACAVKILSDHITHKSDVGGVRLGLESAEAVELAAAEMLGRIAREHPEARISGVTVQAMIDRPRAHELIIGMSVDPTFGPMLLFGAGGTAVEVLRDTVQGLPPLDMKLARDLIRGTRLHRLLEGYRDRPPADLDAIAAALVRLGALVIAHPEIREIDINPLLADGSGVIALDARVRVMPAAAGRRQPLSIRPYPAAWERRETLHGVGALLIRPIRPEDEPLYERFIARTSTSDLRLRFFTARPDLSHRLIARLTQIDYAREMAFVTIDEGTGDLVGVARLVADPDYTRAEFAILVASDIKGHGLGTRLMQLLIAYAQSEGLVQLYGDVLAENAVMLEICRALGFSIAADAADPGMRRVERVLSRALDATWRKP
jgi:acetyltransferase